MTTTTASSTSARRLGTGLVAAALGFAAFAGGSLPTNADRPDDAVSILRVEVDDEADVAALIAGGYDLVESRGDNYLLVVGENAVANALRAEGFRVSVDRELTPIAGVPGRLPDGSMDRTTADSQLAAETFYGGYRTVDEHLLHLDSVAATYPDLATVVDYGASWRSLNSSVAGSDLTAICITDLQAGDCALSPNSAKPRAVIMAAIHARELQTAELAWRLIDELTAGYGTNPDITMILDTTEVWVIPVVNPDGREIVESGGNAPYLQRKNANNSVGNCAEPPTSSNQHGVDLNRNADYQWSFTGTSANPCAQTYHGGGPASEPEQSSLEALFRNLWPDQRDENNSNTPVASDATGSFITIHSYGELVLLPPGVGGTTSNDAQLRAFAFRMSHYNDYRTGTGPEILYDTAGTTDDWVYGRLGVASFTYEVSPTSGSCGGFTPAYTCIEGLWQRNRDALMYSLKVAGAPYQLPLGPTTTSASAPALTDSGSSVALEAVVDDNAYGTASLSVSRPSARAVTAAEYFVDTLPGEPGTGTPMVAVDDNYGDTSETVTVDIAGLAVGDHTAYVRGRTDAGWGPVAAVSFTVEDTPVGGSVTASSDTPVSGTVSGSFEATHAADGNSQTITEAESGGRKSRRHDLAEHRWTFPPLPGNQLLTVVASAIDAGDADDGFDIEWSTNGTTWVRSATVRAGEPISESFDIGQNAGEIQVRVVDSDRSSGQRSLDAVSVDLLRIDSGGVGEPPTATEMFATLTVKTKSAGRGQSHGEATVEVIDNLGNPVGGAWVTIEFTGDLNEIVVVITEDDGRATATTIGTARKPAVAACINSLSAGTLDYPPGSESCPP